MYTYITIYIYIYKTDVNVQGTDKWFGCMKARLAGGRQHPTRYSRIRVGSIMLQIQPSLLKLMLNRSERRSA